ncbi:MAG: DUF192 domain-containing protein [Deltaproteobacteria bacterium]|nr:DUF192 domain-containing protein [Deltaproteobacteria bacterium]
MKSFGMGARWRLLPVCVLLFCLQAACDRAPSVIFEGPDGVKATFSVEVARTPEKRRWGLMYRQDLGNDEGMLFIFPDESDHSFWMKNTPLSLDMIFMDRRRRVVGIIHDTVPFSTRSVRVGVASRYVLEVRAGVARRHHIAVGDVARFERLP